MMNLMNYGRVEGRLVRDVEIKETNGRKYAFVNVAVQRNYKNKETDKYESDFLSFTAGEQQAEFIAKHFKKGDVIALTYSLFSSTKKDAEGKNITTEGKRVENVAFVPGATKKADAPAEKAELASAPAADFAEISDDDDDLPF